MKSKEEKERIIEELKKELADASSAFLFDFRGVNVGRVNELRQKVRETESSYRVVKNTLVGKAVSGTDMEKVMESLDGMTAIAYNHQDPVRLAKVLSEFAKANPTFTFKSGIVEGRVITGDQLKTIASIPSREDLLTKLVYLLQSPIRRLVTTLSGPMRSAVTVLNQIAEQKEQAEK